MQVLGFLTCSIRVRGEFGFEHNTAHQCGKVRCHQQHCNGLLESRLKCEEKIVLTLADTDIRPGKGPRKDSPCTHYIDPEFPWRSTFP